MWYNSLRFTLPILGGRSPVSRWCENSLCLFHPRRHASAMSTTTTTTTAPVACSSSDETDYYVGIMTGTSVDGIGAGDCS
jgi:hypothetical protein